jgi:hypothetical protein
MSISDFPEPASAPPVVASGTVALFRDNFWRSQRFDVTIAEGAIQSISSTPMQDQATWVAFNLPVGTVVTLVDNVITRTGWRRVGDLADLGRCVDLVGTGHQGVQPRSSFFPHNR